MYLYMSNMTYTGEEEDAMRLKGCARLGFVNLGWRRIFRKGENDIKTTISLQKQRLFVTAPTIMTPVYTYLQESADRSDHPSPLHLNFARMESRLQHTDPASKSPLCRTDPELAHGIQLAEKSQA